MKTVKSLALMTMGGMMVLAYQKYKKPLMDYMETMLSQEM